MLHDDKLVIGGREFGSRLFLGSGKFQSPEMMKEAIAASGASIATVALRRMNLGAGRDESADIAEPRKGMPLAASPIVFTIPLPILSEPRP